MKTGECRHLYDLDIVHRCLHCIKKWKYKEKNLAKRGYNSFAVLFQDENCTILRGGVGGKILI